MSFFIKGKYKFQNQGQLSGKQIPKTLVVFDFFSLKVVDDRKCSKNKKQNLNKNLWPLIHDAIYDLECGFIEKKHLTMATTFFLKNKEPQIGQKNQIKLNVSNVCLKIFSSKKILMSSYEIFFSKDV